MTHTAIRVSICRNGSLEKGDARLIDKWNADSLSVLANRTNEIMKTLTVFASIMLPLTVIAGIYGMNFVNIPELHWTFGYWYALGLMAITVAIMLVWFRRRGWIGRARR